MAIFAALIPWGILITGFIVYWFMLVKIWTAGLPPGPFPLPLVGNLFSLRQPAYETFAKFSKQYGPVIFVKLGMLPVVVVSDAAGAKEVLHGHDADFAHRPRTKLFEIFSFGFKDLACASRDDAAALRKVSSTHLFTGARLKLFVQSREAEIRSVVKSICSLEGSYFDVEAMAAEYASNIICTMLFGHKLKDAKKMVQAIVELGKHTTDLNVGVMFPPIDFLDLHGHYKVTKKCASWFKSMLNELISQRRMQSVPGDDFLGVLLSMGTLDDITITGLIVDMIAAGVDTSQNTIEWAMAELLCNPNTMKQAQTETDKVVGRSRLIQESDLNELPYIQAILKETLRLHPPVPLCVPHYNEEPSTISRYKIPAKCQVFINIWAIGRNPNQWVNPTTFMPERFVDESKEVGLTGNFELLPFSAGRRMCVGYPLVTKSIPLAIANLVHAFKWEPASNINLAGRKGTMTMKTADSIRAIAHPRLDQAAYL